MPERSLPSTAAQKDRLLTGDRPTGPLHLGHLLGSLQSRVAMQDSHECFLIVADLHTLTTRPERDRIAELPRNVRAVVLDLLSVGIDPEKSTIYLQSGVPAVYDLAILLQMLIPASHLRSLASIAQMAKVAGVDDERMSLGLLGYPVLQAADILMARAQLIPVGGDNLAHVEIAREVAQSFNEMYAEVFPLPEGRASRVPMLPGIGPDGPAASKMSKSAGNTINLGDTADVVASKLRTLGGARLRGFIDALIGNGDDDDGQAKAMHAAHQAGKLSDAAVHDRLITETEALLAPLRERRAAFEADEGLVEEILVDGTIRAREVAYATLQQVREAMGLEPLWKGLIDVAERRALDRKKPY
ncbi:Tryptophanyl-tRNA synthetase [Enhygromyxa salina]|uniref:Tryptophan--tRNA ligase n=1 Tax=Enhygromyxa salina TaxID=215803 RepID=A0A0C1Z823_9BACT|nr:tryptophan--tRNA ligase [Enhygromyxa salina]KIG13769.1 Tryptophanyl-tRNA synthetase [Enhygromyxa salina]